MEPRVTVTTVVGHEGSLRKAMAKLSKCRVLVGVPETTALDRKRETLSLSMKARGKKKARLEKMATESSINNAQLVYIHSNGSPLRKIPARPIIEPAITDPENNEKITDEMGVAAKAGLDGKPEEVTRALQTTALLAEGIVRDWFTNPKNHWAPNAPSTIRRKKSSRPLIDTAQLRRSIVGLVSEGN